MAEKWSEVETIPPDVRAICQLDDVEAIAASAGDKEYRLVLEDPTKTVCIVKITESTDDTTGLTLITVDAEGTEGSSSEFDDEADQSKCTVIQFPIPIVYTSNFETPIGVFMNFYKVLFSEQYYY